MSIDILALDGDGIGPEIMQSTLDIVDFLNKELKNEVKNEFEDINELYLKKFPNENTSFSAISNKFNLRIDTKFSSSLNETLLLPNIYQELLSL